MQNSKKIGIALEKYKKDHKGRYPPHLYEIEGKYIDRIPQCAAGDNCSYKETYRLSRDFKRYTFQCFGKDHKRSSNELDWPMYNWEMGMKEAKEPGLHT